MRKAFALTICSVACACLVDAAPRAAAATDPVVPGFVVTTYADVAGPISLTFDASGALFCGRDVPGSQGGDTVKIHRIGPGGSPVDEFGTDGIPDPDGALVDLDGSISGTAGAVVVCGDVGGSQGQIVAVKPDQSIVTLSAASPVMSNPNYMARGRDGLLIADSGNNTIFQFVPPGPPTVFASPAAAPYHMAVDGAKRVFVSQADGAISVWDAGGSLVDGQFATGLTGGPTLAFAHGGGFGTDLYAINPGTGELVRIAPDKTATVVGAGFPSSLGSMTFGPDGALYVALYEEGRVLRIALAAPVETQSFFLSTALVFKANADPAKATLVSAGVFDTGPTPVDLSLAATLEIGSLPFSVPSLTVKGRSFVFKKDGVALTIKPNPKGTSRASFKLTVKGGLTGAFDPNVSVKLRFTNAAVDAVGEVKLTGGKYRFGKIRGALVTPNVYPAKVAAKLGAGATDSFKLLAGLATDGVTPASPSDVAIEIGDVFRTIVPASAFTRKGDKFVATAPLRVVLDYAKEKIQVTGKNVDLGDFLQGANQLHIGLAVGGDARAVRVRSVGKGRALSY